ncbi:unnamed protein product, partial [Cyprideis torosa]
MENLSDATSKAPIILIKNFDSVEIAAEGDELQPDVFIAGGDKKKWRRPKSPPRSKVRRSKSRHHSKARRRPSKRVSGAKSQHSKRTTSSSHSRSKSRRSKRRSRGRKSKAKPKKEKSVSRRKMESRPPRSNETCLKFLLLLWKNYVIYKRHWCTTCYTVCCVCMIGLLCMFFRLCPLNTLDPKSYESFDPGEKLRNSYPFCVSKPQGTQDACIVGFTPGDQQYKQVMEDALKELGMDDAVIQGFPNEEDMVDELKNFTLTPPEATRKTSPRFQRALPLVPLYDLSDGKCKDSMVQDILNISCESFKAMTAAKKPYYFLMGVVFEPFVNACQKEVELTLRPLSHLTKQGGNKSAAENRRGWSLNELYPPGLIGMLEQTIAKAKDEQRNRTVENS